MRLVPTLTAGFALAAISIIGFAVFSSRDLDYRAMEVKARVLMELNEKDGFEMLYFNQKYDRNSILERDESSLTASAWTKDMDSPIPITEEFIIPVDGEETKLSCNIFSNFILTKQSVDYLVRLPEVARFVFTPEYFPPDKSYICFKVEAFNTNGDPIDIESRYTYLNPCPPARPY